MQKFVVGVWGERGTGPLRIRDKISMAEAETARPKCNQSLVRQVGSRPLKAHWDMSWILDFIIKETELIWKILSQKGHD